MSKLLKRASISTLCLAGCVVVGFVLPVLWSNSLRDFRVPGVIAAGLIATSTFVLRSRFRWDVLSLLISLFVFESFLYLAICYFSGSYAIDSFNLNWFLGLNLFVGAPWLAGIVAARIFVR